MGIRQSVLKPMNEVTKNNI